TGVCALKIAVPLHRSNFDFAMRSKSLGCPQRSDRLTSIAHFRPSSAVTSADATASKDHVWAADVLRANPTTSHPCRTLLNVIAHANPQSWTHATKHMRRIV